MKFKTNPKIVDAVKFTGVESINEMRVLWPNHFEKVSVYSAMENVLIVQGRQVSKNDWVVKDGISFTTERNEAFSALYQPA